MVPLAGGGLARGAWVPVGDSMCTLVSVPFFFFHVADFVSHYSLTLLSSVSPCSSAFRLPNLFIPLCGPRREGQKGDVFSSVLWLVILFLLAVRRMSGIRMHCLTYSSIFLANVEFPSLVLSLTQLSHNRSALSLSLCVCWRRTVDSPLLWAYLRSEWEKDTLHPTPPPSNCMLCRFRMICLLNHVGHFI
eukprot:RCo048180